MIQFEQLPDDIILTIFDRLYDINEWTTLANLGITNSRCKDLYGSNFW